jgi:hypothetical protein
MRVTSATVSTALFLLGFASLGFPGAIHSSTLRLAAYLHAWKVIDPVRLPLALLHVSRHTVRSGNLLPGVLIEVSHEPPSLFFSDFAFNAAACA